VNKKKVLIQTARHEVLKEAKCKNMLNYSPNNYMYFNMLLLNCHEWFYEAPLITGLLSPSPDTPVG